MVKILRNNTFILVDDHFPSIEVEPIQSAKIMIQDKEYLTPTNSLKFNVVQIKLDSKKIILTKKSHVGGVLLEINHVAESTCYKVVTKKKLSPKEHYLPLSTVEIYIAHVCQSKASFIFSDLLPSSNFCQIILQS